MTAQDEVTDETKHLTHLLFAVGRMLDNSEMTTDGCIEFKGCKNSKGYGVVSMRGQRHLAHRLSYEFHVGPIPEGLTIDHLCRNKVCVNPAHLEPVTGAENSRRAGASITSCKYGHEYTPENTIVKKRGAGRSPVRNCRACYDERRYARSFTLDYLDRKITPVELDEWLTKSAERQRDLDAWLRGETSVTS